MKDAPVNATALTAFIFPLSLGYAIVTDTHLAGDLFGVGLGAPAGALAGASV